MSLRVANCVCEVYDDDMSAAILNLKTRQWFFLSASAGRIWSQVRHGKSFADAYKTVAGFYGIDAARLEEDMRRTIRTLIEGDVLLEVVSNAS